MSGVGGHDRARTARRLAASLAMLVLIALAMVFGPRLVSGNYHRAAIERMATDALGRRVSIAGPIALSILPEPQLRADTITIGSPKGGLITAATLKLDLAPWPLLLGRLRATKLGLRKPEVTLPWPLPGGAGAVAPPPWLASLHATIVDGVFRLGALTFRHADLSIFTGGPNAVLAASGSAELDGRKLDVTLAIANTGGDAPAPVTASVALADDRSARLDFKGTLDRASTLDGAVSATAPGATMAGIAGESKALPAASLRARLIAGGSVIALHDIDGAIGTSRIGGHATIALAPAPLLRLDLTGRDWALGRALGSRALRRGTGSLPIVATIDLADSSYDGIGLESLRMRGFGDRFGRRIQSLAAALPGGGALTLMRGAITDGRLAAGTDGRPSGMFRLTAPNPNATIAGLRPALPDLPNWPTGLGGLEVSGRFVVPGSDRVALGGLRGRIGGRAAGSVFTGALRLGIDTHRVRIAARLAFERLLVSDQALASLVASAATLNGAITGPFDITAHHLVVLRRQGGGRVTRFAGDTMMLDGALRTTAAGGGIAIDLATLRLGKALLVGHGARSGTGGIVAARLLLTGPDAGASASVVAPLFGVAMPWAGLALLHHRFAAALVAAGPAAALHAGLTLHLGAIRAAASPVIDLPAGSAAGALSLLAPDAARLIGDSGGGVLLGARHGLGWPGAGSASLRAAGFVTPTRVGLSDFVLSLGALTASGQISASRDSGMAAVTGSIAADTLAIPAPGMLTRLANAGLAGSIGIDLPLVTAARIEQDNTVLARNASLAFGLAQGKDARSLTLAIDRAGVAGGVLDGSAVLTLPAGAAGAKEALNLAFHLRHAEAAMLDTDVIGVKPPLTAGTLDLATNLTAGGDAPSQWRTSLAGRVTGSGTGLAVGGIDLAAAGQALAAALAVPPPPGGDAVAKSLRRALTTGTTAFDTGSLDATMAAGVMTLGRASLAGKQGTLAATGTIDPIRRSLKLTMTIQPAISPSAAGPASGPALTIDLGGTPDHPVATPHADAATAWIAARAAHGGP